MAGTGQIEISTTPYYHPILPLLCDSNIAGISHPPNVPPAAALPLSGRRARPNSPRARDLRGAPIRGSRRWGCGPARARSPTKPSPSPASSASSGRPPIAGVLNRTKQTAVPVDGLYRPYEWRPRRNALRLIFRDPFMSDPDRLRLFEDGAEPRRRRTSCIAFARTAPAILASGPRRAGSHHSRWRKRVGILLSQRPPVPARAVSPHH